MKTEDFIGSIENTFKELIDVVKKKNADYAGNGDALKNLKLFSLVMEGVDLSKCDPTEVAFMVRKCDKISRMATLMAQEPAVVEEKFEDTLGDDINYNAMWKAYREFRAKQNV